MSRDPQRTGGAVEVAAIVYAVRLTRTHLEDRADTPAAQDLRARMALLVFFIHGMSHTPTQDKAIGDVIVGVAIVQIGIKGVKIAQLISAGNVRRTVR